MNLFDLLIAYLIINLALFMMFSVFGGQATIFFRWYDLWIGIYVDIKNRTIYHIPFPMIGIKYKY